MLKNLWISHAPMTEDLATLQERLRGERDPKHKVRVHLLVLLKAGRSQAAAKPQPIWPSTGIRSLAGSSGISTVAWRPY
jgi:hypothetical protein